MKISLLAGGLFAAVMLLSSPVMAQSQRSVTQSGAQAVAIAGGGGVGSDGRWIRQRIDNNPDISLGGSVPTAPCVIPSGGGGSGGGVGIVLNLGLTEEECMKLRRIEMARVLEGGNPVIAREMACDAFRDYREARARVGRPCLSDTPVEVPVASQAVPVAVPVTNRTRPSYCRPGVANSECN